MKTDMKAARMHETSELVRQVFGENLFTIFSGLLTESFLEV